MSGKLWGGRFEKDMNAAVARFSSSLEQDVRLWRADIEGSIAHARMLGRQGIVSKSEAEALISGLHSLREDLEARFAEGSFPFRRDAEDIHSEIERLLREKIGPVAGKLHTARSRNDQVATAFRLTVARESEVLGENLKALQKWLTETAEKETQTLMPGLTHFQHAQPVSLAHHLLAYFWMLDRDRERLSDFRKRVLSLPLGSAALAGTSFPIDRSSVAEELGFHALCENSLDAVSDRDFVIELLSATSLLMMHLSRLCEELIIWSAPEHSFIVLDDSVTTGSSIMPQKKNPDVAELIRGRSGRAYGALMGALTMMKGLPLAYNRDLQEDKVFLFQGLDVALESSSLMLLMLQNAEFNRDRMAAALKGDFSNATDLADDLASKGIAFREAHEIVGGIVGFCLREKRSLEELSLQELRSFHSAFDESTLEKLQPLSVMSSRTSRGGTSEKSVLEQIKRAKERL